MSKMGSEEFEKLKEMMREDTKTFTETHYVHLINEIKEVEEERAKDYRNDPSEYNWHAVNTARQVRRIARDLSDEKFPKLKKI
jgi:ribonuclease HIII